VRIDARPPDAAAFAPFGEFIDRPADAGTRQMYSHWLAPVPGLRPQLHTNLVGAAALPLQVTRVERHPHAAQTFLPLRGARYLVTVMPSAPDGRPDVARAEAFVVPSTLGVAYRPGVWHTGIVALDTDASFAVLMWRGAVDDDVFVDVPTFSVAAASAPIEGGPRG
jgi:ureidoglycolate lyase